MALSSWMALNALLAQKLLLKRERESWEGGRKTFHKKKLKILLQECWLFKNIIQQLSCRGNKEVDFREHFFSFHMTMTTKNIKLSLEMSKKSSLNGDGVEGESETLLLCWTTWHLTMFVLHSLNYLSAICCQLDAVRQWLLIE